MENTRDRRASSREDGSGDNAYASPGERSVFHEEDEMEGLMSRWVTILLLVLGIITVLVNFGVLIRIYKLRKKSIDLKPAFFFIGNLAVCGFLIGFYVVIVFCIDLAEFSTDWRDSCCGLLTAISVTTIQETIFTIMLIAVDKYIFICHPLKYREIVSTRKVYASIAISWAISIIIGFLPAMGLQDDWDFCNFVLYISEEFAILLLLTAVLIPLTVICIMYGFILVLAIKMTRTKMKAKVETASGSSSVFRLSFMSRSTRSSRISRNTVRTLPSDSANEIGHPHHTDSTRRKNTRRPSNENQILINEASFSENSMHSTQHLENGKAIQIPEEQPLKIEPHKSPTTARGLSTVFEETSEDTKSTPRNSSSKSSKNTELKEKRISPISSRGSYDLKEEPSSKGRKISREEVTLTNVIALDEEYQASMKSRRSSINSSSEDEEDDKANEEQPSSRFSQRWRKKSYYRKVLSETKDKVEFLKKCKAIKTVFMIIGSFMVTYVPFVVGTFVYKMQDDKSDALFRVLNNLLYCAVVANSLINPVIYAYGFKEFRVKTKHLKGILARDARRERARRM